jgi:hypothetical protein
MGSAAKHVLTSMTLDVTVPKVPYPIWHWRGSEARWAHVSDAGN